MLAEQSSYIGSALFELIEAASFPIAISKRPSISRAAYVLDGIAGSVGLHTKHSTLRTSPWGFTYTAEHKNEIAVFESEVDHVFAVLVCGQNGIVALDQDDLRKLINLESKAQEWVRAIRPSGKRFRIRGSQNDLDRKIGAKDWVARVLSKLK